MIFVWTPYLLINSKRIFCVHVLKTKIKNKQTNNNNNKHVEIKYQYFINQ